MGVLGKEKPSVLGNGGCVGKDHDGDAGTRGDSLTCRVMTVGGGCCNKGNWIPSGLKGTESND
ncbi:hypothetical protein C1H46_035915 [Malus baccata]|uniref:Uncharacterized protein n=1 Tax=Malus baccata TaxID=106549 RepID=A0A540KWM6_MALBA|nr:hypothetical protein C1H46_035915 [Malus baccata]